MSTTIVELAEQGLGVKNSNPGDYEVVLSEPILINPGDEVSVKNVFVDSVSGQNSQVRTVNVAPDVVGGKTTTIKITFGYYYLDWGSSQEEAGKQSKNFTTYTVDGKAGSAAPTHGSFKKTGIPYILNFNTSKTTSHSLTGFTAILDLKAGPKMPQNTWAIAVEYKNPTNGLTVNWGIELDNSSSNISKYLQADGSVVISVATIAAMKADGVAEIDLFAPKSSLPINVNLFNGAPIFLPSDPGGDPTFPTSIITLKDFIGSDLADTQIHDIYTQSISFQIPAKSYEAADLADIITVNMTELNATGAANPNKNYILSNNPLIKTITQLRNEDPFVDSAGFPGDEVPTFVNFEETGFSSFAFTSPKVPASTDKANGFQNFIIGSTQFACLYDDEHDKFVINQMHNHLYSSEPKGPGIPETRFIRTANDTPISLIDRCGGVFITQMTPAALFQGPNSVMKFDEALTQKPETVYVTRGTDNQKFSFEVLPLIVGVNCTADEMGLDSLIKKVNPTSDTSLATAATYFDTVIPIAGTSDATAGVGTIVVNTQKVLGIRAAHTLSVSNDADLIKKTGGYFKIEIDVNGLQQDVREQKSQKNNRIHAIVSRYYEGGGYTTAYNEGSIPILYQGPEARYISNFKVRILSPDGELANPIGDTNSVFLQIDRK
tara:strand:+ start:744 stop:2729 length:1986 start_codon:yes stop_codon:yes gene_type:complete